LVEGSKSGWQAACSGEQTIRLILINPKLSNISTSCLMNRKNPYPRICFAVEHDNEDFFREILRQQYNFSQSLTTQEIENISVDLKQ